MRALGVFHAIAFVDEAMGEMAYGPGRGTGRAGHLRHGVVPASWLVM